MEYLNVKYYIEIFDNIIDLSILLLIGKVRCKFEVDSFFI